jgi:hypothetical protein
MSVALEEWQGPSSLALDEIELLYWQVEFVAAGEPTLTEQINHHYVTLLVAHFQRYCRAVHVEATRALAASVLDLGFASVIRQMFAQRRLLDRGNPTPTALGSDFGRFGLRLWQALEKGDRRTRTRKEKLERLCEWRNGITHGDLPRKRAAGLLVPAVLTLETCRDWRAALGGLAISIDKAVAARCRTLGCPEPWW